MRSSQAFTHPLVEEVPEALGWDASPHFRFVAAVQIWKRQCSAMRALRSKLR
jgi:hypothetical protein